MTAWSQPPDQEERYINDDEPIVLVVKHYNDIPNFVNYHYEDIHNDVYDAGAATIEEINNKIRTEGWELLNLDSILGGQKK